MLRHNWSGSKTSLLCYCAWWARPDVELPPRVANEHADSGIGNHGKIERLKRGGKPESTFDENVLEWAPSYDGGKPECAIAYNPLTGEARELVSNGQRDYSDLREGEVPLTLDYCGAVDGEGFVDDWKFGIADHIGPVQQEGQMRLGALAFARLRGLDSVTATIWFVDDDGSLKYKDEHTFDVFELDEIEQEMRQLWEKLHSDPTPVPGPWCKGKFCPAIAICPATTQAIVATPLAPLCLRIDSDDQCARIYTQMKAAEEFLKAVKRAHDEYVTNAGHPIELADGSTLEVVTKSREKINVNDKVLDALRRDGLDHLVEMRLAKSDIESAIKEKAPRGKAAGMIRDVLDGIRATGACSVSSYSSVERVKARKER